MVTLREMVLEDGESSLDLSPPWPNPNGHLVPALSPSYAPSQPSEHVYHVVNLILLGFSGNQGFDTLIEGYSGRNGVSVLEGRPWSGRPTTPFPSLTSS